MKAHVYEVVDRNNQLVYILINEKDKWNAHMAGEDWDDEWAVDPSYALYDDDKSIELIHESMDVKEAIALVKLLVVLQ